MPTFLCDRCKKKFQAVAVEDDDEQAPCPDCKSMALSVGMLEVEARRHKARLWWILAVVVTAGAALPLHWAVLVYDHWEKASPKPGLLRAAVLCAAWLFAWVVGWGVYASSYGFAKPRNYIDWDLMTLYMCVFGWVLWRHLGPARTAVFVMCLTVLSAIWMDVMHSPLVHRSAGDYWKPILGGSITGGVLIAALAIVGRRVARSPRFSVRALFVAVAVSALLMGALSLRSRQLYRQWGRTWEKDAALMKRHPDR